MTRLGTTVFVVELNRRYLVTAKPQDVVTGNSALNCFI
jgi:hypothetical protein